jgi:hypothetical protein
VKLKSLNVTGRLEMLAYVFWHWPNPTLDPQEYRQKLRDFHRTLANNRSEGFEKSLVFAMSNPSWLGTSGTAYEDWYLLEDSAALDKLNYAAVYGACEMPHNRVAREAASRTAGLYRLRQGSHEGLANSAFACWFRKPDGLSYVELDSQLKPLISNEGASLWARQMTLGPTMEFCLRSQQQPSLPQGFAGESLALEAIWPSKLATDPH